MHPDFTFSQAANSVQPSLSMARGLGETPLLYNLAVGSPDLAPPKEVSALMQAYVEQNRYGYAPSKGSIKGLKALHNVVLGNDNSIDPNQNLMLLPGAKYAIYLALKTLVSPKEQVFLFAPYWLSYPEICKSLDLAFQELEMPAPSQKISMHAFLTQAAKVHGKPKAIILNNPNNPGGWIHPNTDLEELVDWCQKEGVWLIYDEVYKDLVFPGETFPSVPHFEGLVRIGSLSKSLCLAGLRLAYMSGPAACIQKADALGQHIHTCIAQPALWLAEHLEELPFAHFTQQCAKIYQERYTLFSQALERKGYTVWPIQAAFYILTQAKKEEATSGEELANRLEKRGLMVTPGNAYGKSLGHTVRVCLTLPKEKLVAASELF